MTTFQGGAEVREFTYSVATADGGLHISLEDSVTKEQWATPTLAITDFVTAEGFIPHADIHVNFTHSASSSA